MQLQQHRLTFSIAAEDCKSRSLIKCDTAEGSSTVQENKSETEMNDEEWIQENGGNSGDSGEENDEAPIPKPRGISEYEKRREKNIAELKTILEGLNNQYPTRLREDPAPKPAVKKSVSKKKKDGTPVERRVSMRNKGKDNVDNG
jgi:hypothetical protein